MGFLCVEGKTIPLCGMKVHFLLKKQCVPSLGQNMKRSLINRSCYKKFDGFSLRVLPMGRGKIEREIKREKRNFQLGLTKEERVQSCHLRGDIANEKRENGCRLWKDSQGGKSKVLSHS